MQHATGTELSNVCPQVLPFIFDAKHSRALAGCRYSLAAAPRLMQSVHARYHLYQGLRPSDLIMKESLFHSSLVQLSQTMPPACGGGSRGPAGSQGLRG
jgi:hypothetical protein